LEYHLLVEVWCTKGGFTEAIDERSEWFIGFLSDTHSDMVVVWCGRLLAKWVENMWERMSKLSIE